MKGSGNFPCFVRSNSLFPCSRCFKFPVLMDQGFARGALKSPTTPKLFMGPAPIGAANLTNSLFFPVLSGNFPQRAIRTRLRHPPSSPCEPVQNSVPVQPFAESKRRPLANVPRGVEGRGPPWTRNRKCRKSRHNPRPRFTLSSIPLEVVLIKVGVPWPLAANRWTKSHRYVLRPPSVSVA